MDQKIEITEIRIFLSPDPTLRAFATVTISEFFVIRGIKIVELHNGLEVVLARGDTVHPSNRAFVEMLKAAILEAYHEKVRTSSPRRADLQKDD